MSRIGYKINPSYDSSSTNEFNRTVHTTFLMIYTTRRPYESLLGACEPACGKRFGLEWGDLAQVRAHGVKMNPARIHDLSPVPEVVILRLPLYVRVLIQLQSEKIRVVSSQQLGDFLQMTPAQIRKDLNYFGRFGKQGRGYNINFLLAELRHILGLNQGWGACLIGIGRLGRAIINYPGFSPEGFEIVAAFDSDHKQIGTSIGNLFVQSMAEIASTVSAKNIAIGIVAVPSLEAQEVIDLLIRNGVKGILNYAPIAPRVPDGIVMRNIDPVLSLQSMTYYLKNIG